jgi:hypothetical protein
MMLLELPSDLHVDCLDEVVIEPVAASFEFSPSSVGGSGHGFTDLSNDPPNFSPLFFCFFEYEHERFLHAIPLRYSDTATIITPCSAFYFVLAPASTE